MTRRNATGDGAVTTAVMFGNVLRHFRERAGLKQAELARQIPCDRSQVAKVETGLGVPSDVFVSKCDEVLDTGGLLLELWGKVDWYPDVGHPDWFEHRAQMDAECVALMQYQDRVIPGLLQTEDYARALFATEPEKDEIEDRVRARLSRQQRFFSPGNPPLYVALLEESCLRTVIGGADVMHDQLAQVLAAGKRDNIRIQVVPADKPGILRPITPMSLITLPEGHRWIYSESLERGHLTDEPARYARHAQTYDVLRADALSADESAALIGEFMKGYRHHGHRVAQEQLQRVQRRQLHRSGRGMAQEQLQRIQRRRLRRGEDNPDDGPGA
jgi:transcriptional regulator with XRE-family HTH domain